MSSLSTLCDILHRSADNFGQSIAVDHEDGVLTYFELERYSKAFATRLHDAGVRPGDRVPLLTSHGTRNIVALLGILAAGASYVPMDGDTWSEERIRTVLTIVDGNIMVNTRPDHGCLHEGYKAVQFNDMNYLDDTKEEAPRHQLPAVDSDSLACIIFTSGSTGKPKGVMIPHRAVVNYANTSPFNMGVRCGDRVLHILSVAFDASTGMLFSILRGAGTVVPANKLNLITKAQSCSIIACTPSILTSIPIPDAANCQYPSVHTVLLGGEVIPQELIDGWCRNGRKILNAYGPTETTCASLMHVIESTEDERRCQSNAIIGKAMPNAPVHLLDSDMRELREFGEEGEIVISGPGVALGYFRDEAKTRSAFVMHNGRRIYRTGDYGKWITDANGELVIAFRGRKDRVVKNRGFLVNLDADIETPMASMEFGIQSIHVAQFRKRIVALVCPETIDADELRQAMLKSFSKFMVPDRILAVAALPMTPNGKVDPRGVLDMLEKSHEAALVDEASSGDIDTTPDAAWLAVKECAQRALGLGNNVALQPASNLFSLGASSLDVLTFVSLCHTRGIWITAADVYAAESLGDLWSGMEPSMDRDGSGSATTMTAGAKREPLLSSRTSSSAPMTPLQLELAQPTLVSNGKNTNRIRIAYAIEHADRIESAWHKVWTTEPIFRTSFSLAEGATGTQRIEAQPQNLPRRSEFSDYGSFRAAVDGVSLCVGLGSTLDFIRYVPAPSEAGEHCAEMAVIWTVHHCLIDGYAMAAILAKVEHAAAGVDSIASVVPFTDAALELVAKQQREDLHTREFWSSYLSGQTLTETLGLPQPRESGDGSKAAEIRFTGMVSSANLRRLASENQVTVATVLYTAWAMVISKYTNQDSVTVGAVVSGRDSPLISDAVIGPLINTLPLVVRLGLGVTIKDVLRQTLRGMAEISPFAHSTSQQINHRPSSVVALQYDYPRYPLTVPRMGTEFFENTAFPLSLLVEDHGSFRLVYDPLVYETSYANDLVGYFQLVLKHMVMVDRTTLSIPPPIGSHLIESLVDSQCRDPPSDRFAGLHTLQEAFAKSSQLHGDLPAVECKTQSLTYLELDQQATKVCRRIRDSLPPSAPIAIHADGSLNWIVGILGILKAGRAYCPLDPQYSLARRAAVCAAGGAVGILFPEACDTLDNKPTPDLPTIAVDDVLRQNGEGVLETSYSEADPDSDALIVFTSGTTGTPKGVPISHRGLLALQSNPEATMFARPGKRIAQMMSPAFDYCANEIFSALLHGATLVLRDAEDPFAHLGTVDAATLTPSLMAALDPNAYSRLRTIYATGEPVTPGLVQSWAPGRDFYNAYGPAEGSICVSFTKLVPGQEITIGRPIRTARMYILDKNFEHQPIGALGELFLAGVQVTRGYLNADEQTRLRFMPDPWHPGQTMYRTGDFCRWTRDGHVFYVGRVDRQVKVRGFRVELPTVEQHIYAVCPQVVLVSVLVVKGALVSVIKPACVDTNKVKSDLSARLPPSWVPQIFVTTDKFPLTQNKKIDMAALTAFLEGRKKQLVDAPALERQPVEAESPVVDVVGNEWRKLLNLPNERPLDALDSFTALGGHSILQMLLSARLSSRLGIRVSLRDVLQADRLHDLVDLVKTRQIKDEPIGDKPQQQLTVQSLSPVEEYQFHEYTVAAATGGRTSMFNIPLILGLSGDFSRTALASALNQVLAAHEVFRSNFTSQSGSHRPQRIMRDAAPRVREHAVTDLGSEVNHNFQLCNEELIRVHLSEQRLVIVASHMVADLNSLQTFFRQVSAVYKAEVTASKLSPPLARTKMEDYISLPRWNQVASAEDRQFWTQYLDRSQCHVALGLPGPGRYEGQSHVMQIPCMLVKKLNRMMATTNSHHPVTRHQLALAAVALTLRKVTLQDDLVLGSPCSCRCSANEQQAMGLCLDRLPIRIGKVHEGMPRATLFNQVRRASQAALARMIPFPELLRVLGYSHEQELFDLRHHPIFEVMVTFHLDAGPHVDHLDVPDCSVSSIPAYAGGAKFLLMFEWTEHPGGDWKLRIEYNTERISSVILERITDELLVTLQDFAK